MLSNRFRNDGKAVLALNEIQLIAQAELKNKLEKSIYKTESVPCLCGSDEFEVLAEKDRYGLPLHTVICRQCGQLMSNPRLDNESNISFYKNEYRSLHVGAKQADEDFYNWQYRKGTNILSFTREYIKNNARILEIGCGAGGIVGAFVDEGHVAIGIDLGPDYLHLGRQNGLDLLCMSSQRFLEENRGKFDLIILSHVLEHFLDIQSELETIKELLTDKGLLYVEVPGIKNIENTEHCDFLKTLQLAHTYHFNFDSLVMAMNRFGFESVAGNEVVQSLFRLGCAGNTNFNNQYQDTVGYLLDLEKNKAIFLKKHFQNKLYVKESMIVGLNDILLNFPDKTVSIYGTGEHTKLLMNNIIHKEKLLCIFSHDQGGVGSDICGLPVKLLSDASPRAIIISSNRYQEVIYRRLIALKRNGVVLIRLYQ